MSRLVNCTYFMLLLLLLLSYYMFLHCFSLNISPDTLALHCIPLGLCLQHSSSQTLNFYCNGKSWSIPCFFTNPLSFLFFQQLPQALTNQQSNPVSSFPVDGHNSNSTPTIVTDCNGNQFLLTLSNQNADTPARGRRPQGKVTNQIKLQVYSRS